MTYGGAHHPDQQHPQGFGPPIPPQPGYGAGYGPGAPHGAPHPPVPRAPVPDGPEFIAHDRRNSVIVDINGVALEIQGQIMEFPWSAIATVHFAPAPFGTVLMVAVSHASGLLYECRVTARRQPQLQQWLAGIGPVLHYYLANRPPAY
ncbi:hypothetical protein ABZ532_08285 [Streptomyces sp. NPDC019396]|uniref:hypothetical protein n=1 Tax=Streptomyces sp. NPDC019396 TaxID=3154687 RepID=UPI0033E0289B